MYLRCQRSSRNNWAELTQFFDYPLEIRKIVYTTNVIESLEPGY
ncbi:MAG: transposase [Bacteroidales bacterium]|nr:transposase [Bacteroidales bacterium]